MSGRRSSSRTRSRGSGACTVVATTAGIAVALVLSGCTGRKSEKVEDKPPPTQLAFELPAGVAVSVDGKALGHTPTSSTDVTPGSHEVKLTTPCGETTLTIDAREATTTAVDLDQAPELKFAKLRVEAKNLEGTPMQPTLRLGEVELGAGSLFNVPACKHRVTIAATQDKGLAAFIEDIEFEPGQSYERKVVLAPGPDMVRIHGGKFVIGPPEAKAEAWAFIDRYPVEVETFDIDRTEVTVAQYLECRDKGGCEEDPGKWGSTKWPTRAREHLCNTRTTVTKKAETVRPAAGRENHPMNCIARWEAEAYCRWVGKRLPTDVEWEYAARSGKEEYDCPYGPEEGMCRGKPEKHILPPSERPILPGEAKKATWPVCAARDTNSEQGVCDLMGNVTEFVEQIEIDGRETRELQGCRGSDWWGGADVSFRHANCDPWQRGDTVGFRCARSGSASHPHRTDP